MKITSTILAALVFTFTAWAQAPQKMSYQAVIRDANNKLVTSHAVGIRVSILQTTATGTSVYTETQIATTNANGLVTLEIGTGTTTGNFSTINWANGPFFIKTETDATGGTNYTITGTSQLLSVPYALYANTADYTKLSNLPNWKDSISNHYIGELFGGGIVFYVYGGGKHGLIVATADSIQMRTPIMWSDTTTKTNIKTSTIRDGIGAGASNTERILMVQGVAVSAAQVCAKYRGGNYGDWYLPSKYELYLMYLQKNVIGYSSYYWSSNELDKDNAYAISSSTGGFVSFSKTSKIIPRAVRAF
jgi:hypothetical protein